MAKQTIKAKKRFGQNFLQDERYLQIIIESMSYLLRLHDGAKVVEIGPGLGDLSLKILNHCDLVAYEIDSELCRYLDSRIQSKNWTLYHKDVLCIEPSDNGWLSEKDYILISNLPYYIATKIVLNLLRDTKCKGMVVMTQKEVALKFCAESGSSDFGAMSVLVQSVANEAKILSLVPASAFNPAPKVESAIFMIDKKQSSIKQGFEKFLRQAFRSPRKKIEKNLCEIENIKEILAHLCIDSNLRAHQISTQEYHKIFDEIQHCKKE